MFESIIDGSLTMSTFIICISVSLILGLLVSFLHIKTSRYTKNFALTLVILPPLVASVMILVNGNLGTGVAVMGAFSLIRFRSIPGNSKEIVHVFFSMTVGLAIGTGYVMFAILVTIILVLFSLFLDKINFGESKTKSKLLKVVIPEDLDYTGLFDDIFEEYLEKYELDKVKTVNMGSLFETIYYVTFKSDINEKEFLDKIRVRNGNLRISLSQEIRDEVL